MGANLGDVSEKNTTDSSDGRLKLILLSALYFLIIAGYTILRDLKNSIFMATVGEDYIPLAKFGVVLFLIPCILFYSKLVDRVRRYHLLMIYSVFYALFSLFVALFIIGHPIVGIGNTDQSPYRLFGWFFYFCVEGVTPFVVSVFWSFVNSVTKPKEARDNYGFLVGGSKLGGMLSAGFAWALLGSAGLPIIGGLSGIAKHQLILVFVSLFFTGIPIVVWLLMRNVAGYHLHGYEAVYQVEKKRSKEGKSKTGIFAGLKMFIKYPYVLGIFGMVFFYEILATVLSYLRLLVAKAGSSSVTETSAFLFKWVFIMQATGFFFSVVGTTAIMKKFGSRISLMLIPVFMATGSLVFLLTHSWLPTIAMIGYVFTKTTHYAFSYPVREQLYIPTLKEIKFKSKSWIDAFGQKFAKLSGGTVNMVAARLGSAAASPFLSVFFIACLALWSGVAFLLGIRYDRAIKRNEVIGLDDDTEGPKEKEA